MSFLHFALSLSSRSITVLGKLVLDVPLSSNISLAILARFCHSQKHMARLYSIRRAQNPRTSSDNVQVRPGSSLGFL